MPNKYICMRCIIIMAILTAHFNDSKHEQPFLLFMHLPLLVVQLGRHVAPKTRVYLKRRLKSFQVGWTLGCVVYSLCRNFGVGKSWLYTFSIWANVGFYSYKCYRHQKSKRMNTNFKSEDPVTVLSGPNSYYSLVMQCQICMETLGTENVA